ncbi:hypothetical protein L218DRAFT_954750 [Marasmius fiardii PR-910]|nr:hypothetical protein L218DRAFT_954750 [Marasmius fiardii PR-910]
MMHDGETLMQQIELTAGTVKVKGKTYIIQEGLVAGGSPRVEPKKPLHCQHCKSKFIDASLTITGSKHTITSSNRPSPSFFLPLVLPVMLITPILTKSKLRHRIIPRAPPRFWRKLIKLLAAFLLAIFVFIALRGTTRFVSQKLGFGKGTVAQSGKEELESRHDLMKEELLILQKKSKARKQRAYASTTWSTHSEHLESHQYHSSGLLEVNTAAYASSHRHPVHDLVKRSQRLWQEKLSGASKTLRDAVDEYERRYLRRPPMGFEKWWAYVKKHDVQLPDEYDQIWRDIEVFWGFDVGVLQSSYWRFVKRHLSSGIYILKKDNWDSPIEHTWSLHNTFAGGHLVELMQSDPEVVKYIPPFRVLMNPDDRPAVRKDWDLWERAVEAARNGRVLPSRREVQQQHRPGFLSSCSPFTISQFPPSLFPSSKERHVKPSLRLPRQEIHEPHTLIYDYQTSTNPCLNPHLLRAHGQYLSYAGGKGAGLRYGGLGEDIDPEGEEGWVGLLSFSPTEIHSDIMAAIPLEWIDDSEPELAGGPTESSQERWARKTDQRLHWRGGTTGMSAAPDFDWELGHRMRMVDFLGDNPEVTPSEGFSVRFRFPDDLEVLDPRPSSDNNGMLKINRTLYNSKFMDVSFSGQPNTCNDGACEELEKRYNWADPVPREGVGDERKFLLDMDGNAWSSRFKRLVSSGSVVLKATVYNEWWADRVQPWVHYVPVQVDLSDLWDIFVFFRGVVDSEGSVNDGADFITHGAHDELAKEIGDNGYEWSRKFWRREDMIAYNFRLLLEYARATSPERDRMSYVYNPLDEV